VRLWTTQRIRCAAGLASPTGLIAVPVHLAAYRERGVLRRLRASGIAA
jgi:hypothetical protein